MNVYNFSSAINSYLSEPYSTLTNGIIFGLPIRGNGQLYEELKKSWITSYCGFIWDEYINPSINSTPDNFRIQKIRIFIINDGNYYFIYPFCRS